MEKTIKRRRRKAEIPENEKAGLVRFEKPEDMHAIRVIREAMGFSTITSAIRFALRRVSDQIENGNLISILPGKERKR